MSSNAQPADVNLLHLEILTPEEVLFEGDVAWIQVPLHDGQLGIWPGHAPLVGALAPGQVRYQLDGQELSMDVVSGILRVGVEHCAILVAQTTAQSEVAPNASDPDVVATLSDALPQEIIETLERGEQAAPLAQEG